MSGKAFSAAAAAFTIVILFAASYERNRAWADDISLLTDAVGKSPRKARALDNLGYAFYRYGDADEALRYYTAAQAT